MGKGPISSRDLRIIGVPGFYNYSSEKLKN